MPNLSELIAHLDALLEVDAFRDYGPNGLQVPGRSEIRTVVTGVSANVELLERAEAEDADLVLVHHGLFWRGDPQQITPLLHRRLKVLYRSDMALAAYHLPLDAHPEHGNNAQLARLLDGADPQPFAEHGGRPIGVRVRFGGEGLTLDELAERVTRVVGGRTPLVVDGGFTAAPRIRTLGIVSGGATDDILEAVDLGLDAFLTGEPAERGFSIARDAGVHFLAAGHHATETFGVRRLGELLADHFGVRHVFADVPNPI